MLRALLILLALCLSLPATAMPAAPCHDMAMAAADGSDRPAQDRPATAPLQHVCVGCVPPNDALRGPVALPALGRAPAPLAIVRRLDIGRGTPPALPPPRG